jgi:A/G-specific adenine glycosylase
VTRRTGSATVTTDTPTPRFAARLLEWHAHHGRHDLPWQQPRTPYRVWLSEVMLQQTQVATVIPYFQRFTAALPDLDSLARAQPDHVMALWAGLGYYSRARNLQRAAQLCVERHGGDLPRDLDALLALPGIGRSTAGAILAQAWGERAAILDGNVKRVLCRSHGIDGFPGTPAVERRLWLLAEALLPDDALADYTQAIMDLGATVCTRSAPRCGVCPLRADCIAFSQSRVAELPSPRPARVLPKRELSWLVLSDGDGRILLQRRPPQGIWGGLWSLPEFADAGAMATALAQRLREAFEVEQLPPVRHVFTHFALTAHPVRCVVGQADARLSVADGDHERWMSRGEIASVGLPQPVRRLLATLAS